MINKLNLKNIRRKETKEEFPIALGKQAFALKRQKSLEKNTIKSSTQFSSAKIFIKKLTNTLSLRIINANLRIF